MSIKIKLLCWLLNTTTVNLLFTTRLWGLIYVVSLKQSNACLIFVCRLTHFYWHMFKVFITLFFVHRLPGVTLFFFKHTFWSVADFTNDAPNFRLNQGLCDFSARFHQKIILDWLLWNRTPITRFKDSTSKGLERGNLGATKSSEEITNCIFKRVCIITLIIPNPYRWDGGRQYPSKSY